MDIVILNNRLKLNNRFNKCIEKCYFPVFPHFSVKAPKFDDCLRNTIHVSGRKTLFRCHKNQRLNNTTLLESFSLPCTPGPKTSAGKATDCPELIRSDRRIDLIEILDRYIRGRSISRYCGDKHNDERLSTSPPIRRITKSFSLRKKE